MTCYLSKEVVDAPHKKAEKTVDHKFICSPSLTGGQPFFGLSCLNHKLPKIAGEETCQTQWLLNQARGGKKYGKEHERAHLVQSNVSVFEKPRSNLPGLSRTNLLFSFKKRAWRDDVFVSASVQVQCWCTFSDDFQEQPMLFATTWGISLVFDQTHPLLSKNWEQKTSCISVPVVRKFKR